MRHPKAWLAWSSGKDSAWALHVTQGQRQVEVTGLLTTVAESDRCVTMHGVPWELVEEQARVLELPVYKVLIPSPCSDETAWATTAAR